MAPAAAVLAPDDRRLIRTGFRPVLTARGADVVGEAADGPPAVCADFSALTPREPEALSPLGRGPSNAEFAAGPALGEATVKSHVARILAELSLRDRARAVVLAHETERVGPGESGGRRPPAP